MRGETPDEGLIAAGIDASRQHTGGLAGQLGYRFQTLVVVRDILECAADNSGDNPLFIQEARDSFTDDLHVIWSPDARNHSQIKAVKDLSWEADLVRQFKDEHRRYPRANLYLVVDAESTRKSMAANRHHHELGYVVVECVDRGWIHCPHLNLAICRWLGQLSLMPAHPTRNAAMWNHIYSTWVNIFGGGTAHIKKLFAEISRTSGYTISSLKPTTRAIDQIVAGLRDAVKGLEFAADGYTIVATTQRGRVLVPIPVDWARIDSEFWTSYPTDPWAFLDTFGGFKSDIDDELDDDW
ncbi:hypothetical protein ACQKKX_04565 [Neorhizobium sp. NPDC001467]|uniref:hypothetical protein n=1 Tax=Neorhizobium sp. NPDC001467 TaxID=3390595 RepID=UPI003D00766B